ncbi:MAG: MATE family efflux transporter, partial [Bacillota bacterium]
MRIQLSEHFTYNKLLRFVFPSVFMMIFTSIYSVVDGLFVSNFAGKTPFAAINLIYPLFMMLGALGFMIGTGGSAIVAKTLGEGKADLANRYFSMLVYVTLVGGILVSLIGQFVLRPVAEILGAEGEMLQNCVLYGRVLLCTMTFFLLQNVFQSFFIVAEKPKLGLGVMVIAGLTNIALDALFIIGFDWGLAGAAVATAISQIIGGVIPVVYFLRKNDSLLSLTKSEIYGGILLKTCINGSSEMMSNLSASVVTMLYNFQLMRFAGENGVAAYGVIMYVNFIFVAILFGYAIGSSPLVSYNYGAGNYSELQNLLQKSLILLGGTGVVLTTASYSAAEILAKVFVGYDDNLLAMTVHGLRIYAFVFLSCGFNIFGSAFFTALNNGVISAVISFLRTLVFECGAVLILPLILGMDGIWSSVIVAELMALTVTIVFLLKQNKRYHY